MPYDFDTARANLVRSLRLEIRDERVLDAFARVPRERFVHEELQRFSYEDRPLPIGHEQTISQPLMVAIMTQALRLRGDEKVLEVGTGSGYQSAVLSLLAREVVSVERVPELAARARERLEELGYRNVHVYLAGDRLGRPEDAPYDAIIVTAGAPDVPQSLIDQLAPGGRMVIPSGGRAMQQLVRVTNADHGVTMENLGDCRFVPLISPEEGWSERVPSTNGARPWA